MNPIVNLNMMVEKNLTSNARDHHEPGAGLAI
jgi:hypothetical protein